MNRNGEEGRRKDKDRIEEAESGHKIMLILGTEDSSSWRLAERSRYRTWAEMVTLSHI